MGAVIGIGPERAATRNAPGACLDKTQDASTRKPSAAFTPIRRPTPGAVKCAKSVPVASPYKRQCNEVEPDRTDSRRRRRCRLPPPRRHQPTRHPEAGNAAALPDVGAIPSLRGRAVYRTDLLELGDIRGTSSALTGCRRTP